MGLPARPPGLMPHVDASEDRPGLLDRHPSDGAIFAPVDFLDDKCAHGDVSELGIELDCGFHFEFSFFLRSILLSGLAQREQSQVQPVEFIQEAHQSGLVSDMPEKDHFSVIQ